MKKPRKTITLQPTDYQPSKAELEKKVRIKTTPENLAKAMVQDVIIKHSPDASNRACVTFVYYPLFV